MGYEFCGSYNFMMASKLKVLKANLKVQNHELFNNVLFRKEMTLKKWAFRMKRK